MTPAMDLTERDGDQLTWIRAASRGDRDAFCSLVRPYLPLLRARVRRAIRNKPEIDPDEIVQDTLVRSFLSMRSFNERYTFAQYLFGIARYAILRHAAEHRREVAVAWEESADPSPGEGTMLPGEDRIPEAFHHIAGAARFPSPDARVQSRHRFRAMLTAFLAYGGFPHQQLAFGYSVMLWGRAKAPEAARSSGKTARRRPDKVEVTGSPDRVVEELSQEQLERAGAGFRAEIEIGDRMDPRELDAIFLPLVYRMGLRGRELFARDRASQIQFRKLAEARIGGTRLADYYGRDPRRSVADWSKIVKTRVRKHMLGDLDEARSPLPMPGRAGEPPVTPGPRR